MSQADNTLVIERLIDAPPAKLYAAWTQPELLKKWFAPLPFTTPIVEMDVRAGGANRIVMQDEQGNQYPNAGVYLEVVENQRLVFTDAYTQAWQPSAKPFMTVVVTFDEEQGKTRYKAIVMHWTAEDRAMHEQMGFYEGWGQCTDQLAALVQSL